MFRAKLRNESIGKQPRIPEKGISSKYEFQDIVYNRMSWKQYGGIKQSDRMPNINTVSIATDLFTMRKAYQGLFTICGELHVSQRFLENGTPVGANVYVDNNIYLSKQLVLGDSSTFIQGDANGVGINVSAPQALLDLSTNISNVLRVTTSNPSAYNIMTQTGDNYGIVFDVDPNRISVDFHHSQSSEPDASIIYSTNQLLLAVPQVLIGSSIDSTATLVVNNTSGSLLSLDGHVTFSPTVHSESTVNPLTTWSNSGTGWSMGGGSLGNKPMGTMGTIEGSQYIPHHMYVQGNLLHTRTTTGINTYSPDVTNALDVNGPVRIQHSELHVEASIVDALSPNQSVLIQDGNVTIMGQNNTYTYNLGGSVYASSTYPSGTQINQGGIFSSKSHGTNVTYWINGIQTVSHPLIPPNANVLSLSYNSSGQTTVYFAFSGLSFRKILQVTSTKTFIDINCNEVFSMDITPGMLFLAGTGTNGGCIDIVDIISGSVTSHTNSNISMYTSIRTFTDGNTVAMATGMNYISVYNGAWTDVPVPGLHNYVAIYDALHAIAVGDAIWFTNDGGQTWTMVTDIGSGNSALLSKIVQVSIIDRFSFLFVCNGNTISIIYVYAPWFFPDLFPAVLDVNGHCILDGDLRSNMSSVNAWQNVQDLHLGGNVHIGRLQLEKLYLQQQLAMAIDENKIKLYRDVTISGNLQIHGNCNIIKSDTASFATLSDGYILGLVGTDQNKMKVNQSGGNVLGAGFFMNYTTQSSSIADPFANSGFVKISDLSAERLSFRSTIPAVVSMVFPSLTTKPNTNSLLLLNTINTKDFDDVTDNYGIISSQNASLPISVQASLMDVGDISLNGNLISPNGPIPLQYLTGLTSNVQANFNAITTKINGNITTSGSAIFNAVTTFNAVSNFNSDLDLSGNLRLNGRPIMLESLVGITGNIQNQLAILTGNINTINSTNTAASTSATFGNVSVRYLELGNLTRSGASEPIYLNYLEGLTGNIQSQIDTIKNDFLVLDTRTGGGGSGNALTISHGIDITGNCTLRGNVVLAAYNCVITEQQLSCLQDVTGNIQNQINGRISIVESRDISLNGNIWLNNVVGNVIFGNISGKNWSINNGNAIFASLQGYTSPLRMADVQMGNCSLLGNLQLISGNISQEQLSFLQNMTGNIQSQINSRVSLVESGNVSLNGNVALNGTVFIGNVTGTNWSLNNGVGAFTSLQGYNTTLQIPIVQMGNVQMGNCFLQGNLNVNGNSVTPQQLSFLQNVSSDIQTQISNKISYTDSGNVTLSGNVFLKGPIILSGNISASGNTVTPTNVGCLKDCNQNIQKALNDLQTSSFDKGINIRGADSSSFDISAAKWSINNAGVAKFYSFSTEDSPTFSRNTHFSQGIDDGKSPCEWSITNQGGIATFKKLEVKGLSTTESLTCTSTAMFKGGITVDIGSIDVHDGDVTANKFSQTSSIRYKKNVEPLSDDYDLEMLMKYKPVTYDLKSGGARQIGFIVEDFVDIGADYFVSPNADGIPDSMDYSRITVHLVKCIQELNKKVERLERS